MKAIVAFSYAQRRLEDEPNPCNERLACEVERLFNENEETVIIAQWEIARKLRADGFPVCHVVKLPKDGSYLDSEGVWQEARIFCKLNEIQTIIPVAQRFLHLDKVKRMIKSDGFTVQEEMIGPIGHDPESLQWWTRGPLRLTAYAVMKLFGYRGKPTYQ